MGRGSIAQESIIDSGTKPSLVSALSSDINPSELFKYPQFTLFQDTIKARDDKIVAEKARLAEIEAEKQRAAELAAQSPQVVVTQQPVYQSSCSDAKSCIYMKESGNNPASVNASGCRGLGQACPGSKLPCGDDYACQDAYFTNYAISKYGSWGAAWIFWQGNGYW